MKNYYLYYRLLYSLHPEENAGVAHARLELQDVLIFLRNEAVKELGWTDQEVQDFFESLVTRDYHHASGERFPKQVDYEVGLELAAMALPQRDRAGLCISR